MHCLQNVVLLCEYFSMPVCTYAYLLMMVINLMDRYGLPVNFQAMLLQPSKKNMKKLREVLYDLYKHLDSSAAIIDVSKNEQCLGISSLLVHSRQLRSCVVAESRKQSLNKV